jgi:hypothetical protein
MTSRLTRSTVVGLAIAAFAAPTALAVPIDFQTPDTIKAHAAVEQKQDLRSPDTRDAATRVEPKQDLRSPDARDASEGRGTYTAPDVMVVKVPEPVPADGGIDWADAGIGAGGLLALMLLGLGGSLAVVHRRQAHAMPGI